MKESQMATEQIKAVKVTCDAEGCQAQALAATDAKGNVELPTNWVEGTARTRSWGGTQTSEYVACGTAHIRKAVTATLVHEQVDAEPAEG